FVLGWLWGVSSSLDRVRPWVAAGGGALLGVAAFSYIAAWGIAPILLALTWLAYSWSGRRFVTSTLALAAGAAAPLLLAAPWLWSHPEMLRDTISRYHVYDAHHATWLQGIR